MVKQAGSMPRLQIYHLIKNEFGWIDLETREQLAKSLHNLFKQYQAKMTNLTKTQHEILELLANGAFIFQHENQCSVQCHVTHVNMPITTLDVEVLAFAQCIYVTDVIGDCKLWGATEMGIEIINQIQTEL
jgi:hypothetical protein